LTFSLENYTQTDNCNILKNTLYSEFNVYQDLLSLLVTDKIRNVLVFRLHILCARSLVCTLFGLANQRIVARPLCVIYWLAWLSIKLGACNARPDAHRCCSNRGLLARCVADEDTCKLCVVENDRLFCMKEPF